jgi:hypothetical protein
MEQTTGVREALELLLEDPSFAVVRAAVEALHGLREKASLAALERLASRRFLDPRLRFVAKCAIKAIGDDLAGRGLGEIVDRIERGERDVRTLRDRVLALEQGPAGNRGRLERMKRQVGRKKRKARR